MIDIEKMKAEFEAKLESAQLSNELEKVVGIETTLLDTSYSSHGTKHMASYGFGCNRGQYFDKDTQYPTIQDAARLLNMFEPTKDWEDRDHNWHGPYRLSTGRSYSDNFGYFEIQWIHHEIDFSFYLRIEAYDYLIGLFDILHRRIVDSELSTYHPVNSKGLLNCDMTIPCYRFKNIPSDRQVCYYRGGYALYDNEKAAEIIGFIKSYAK